MIKIMNHAIGSDYMHSRGHTVVAMMLPKNQSQFSQTMLWQYWLGKASFQINPECFQKVAMEFKS